MPMTSVSIIIPAFNQARFLGAAIESCLNQTHPAIEVVVVDDGSTDDTPQVAARYQNRIIYVRQDNQGLPAARNRGIRESKGAYLCFLDSDDWFHPEKVSRQAALLDEDAHLGFVYCDIETVDEQGKPIEGAPSVGDVNRALSGNLFSSLIMGGYFPPHTVMIRRALLEREGGFDPELGGHADYELWLRISGAGHQASFMAAKLASYRTYSTSMSKDGEHMAASRRAALSKMTRAYPQLVAASVDTLQQSNEDLFHANQWLKSGWERVLSQAGSSSGPASENEQRFDFLHNAAKAVLVRGAPEQKGIWDVTLEEITSKALLLQPPAELAFELPTFLRGTLRTAVAIHPEAWSKAGAGGCEFRIRADGRLAYALALDPTQATADRRWQPITLTIPENPAGAHRIVFETKTVGASSDFRWALWRAPHFVWDEPASSSSEENRNVLTAA